MGTYSAYTPPVEAIKQQADAISSQYFDNTLRKVAYEGSPVLKRMMKNNKIKIKGGRVIQWPVRVDKLGTAAAVDPRASVTWSTNDTRVAAQLRWRFYYATTLIQWDEILENQGKPQLVDLIKDKSEELKDDMSDLLISHLYAASPTETDIESLFSVIDTGAYAGIDPSGLTDPTRWQSQVDTTSDKLFFFDNSSQDGTSGNTSDTTLAEMLNAAKFNDEKPTLIITTEDLYTRIEAYLENKRQITRDNELQNIGYENVKFKNTPITTDPHCPAGNILGINEKHIELVVHPQYDMSLTKWEKHEDYPNALFKGMSFAGNLRADTRHTHFKFTGITNVESGV